MSTQPIERTQLLREVIAASTRELHELETEKAMQERDRIRKQTLITMEQNCNDQETRVASMKELVNTAYETLQHSVKERFTNHRGRFHLAEASVQVNAAAQNLVMQMNGVHEHELSLAASRSRLEEAQRIEAAITKKD